MKFQPVADQVHQHLRQGRLMAYYADVMKGFHGQAFLLRRRQVMHHAIDDCPGADLLQRQICPAETAVIQQVLHQLVHARRRGNHLLQIVFGIVVQNVRVLFAQRLAEAFNGAQRSAQVMGNGIAEGLQFGIGLFAFGNAQFQFLGVALDLVNQLFAFGNVARDFGEPGDLPGLIFQRRDHHARPEARPVFAHAPAFAFIMAFLTRPLQHTSRDFRAYVFRDVKGGKMAAYDLFRQITLNALRPGVPTGDVAFRIQRVDGVIGHALNQQAVALLGHAALAEVAGDLAKANDLPIVILNTGDDYAGPEARAIFTHAPALILEPDTPAGHLQLPSWFVFVLVLLGIESRKMFADDLVRFVALEAFGAGVPTGYITLCI